MEGEGESVRRYPATLTAHPAERITNLFAISPFHNKLMLKYHEISFPRLKAQKFLQLTA